MSKKGNGTCIHKNYKKVPDAVLTPFKKITEKITEIGETWGIWKMHDMVNGEFTNLLNKLPETEKAGFSALIKDFNDACREYDNLDIRKGREVIILRRDV